MFMASKVSSKEINPAKEIKDFTDKEKKAYSVVQGLIESSSFKVTKADATKQIQRKEVYEQIYQCKKTVKFLVHNRYTNIQANGKELYLNWGGNNE